MAKLYLVDHSLRSSGDHHFDFVWCLARSAREMGFETIVAAHRDFRGTNQLSDTCTVRPLFHRTAYEGPSYLSAIERMQRRSSPFARRRSNSILGQLSNRWQLSRLERKRRGFVESFARDCEQLFAHDTFDDDDHVLFTTVTELEVMATTAYMASHPRTLQVNWHWLLHFPAFEPPSAEFPRQIDRLRELKRCLAGARNSIPYHQAHFYTTTDQLAEQYDRFGIGPVERLPYPISERFAPDSFAPDSVEAACSSDRPIRITCPGAVRREKGQREFLKELIETTAERDLVSGRAQIELQSPPKKRAKLKLPSVIRSQQGGDPSRSAAQDESAILFRDYPLSADDYASMIRETDCGLLMYDSHDYYARRAGVLGELLAVGRPVIVSAGNWLSEQLKEAHFQYGRRLASGPHAGRSVAMRDCQWSLANVPLAGGIICCDEENHPFELELDIRPDEGGAVFEFGWHDPRESGGYVRVDCLAENDELVSSQVIGHPENAQCASVFLRFKPGMQRLKLRLRNFHPGHTISLRDLSFTLLDQEAANLPLAVVGLVASDRQVLPLAIDELINHYQHYRRTAEQFAARWYPLHRPTATISRLLVAGESLRKAA